MQRKVLNNKTVVHVVGARPNFMKAAPVLKALNLRQIGKQVLVHTGQHYDQNMSEVFFRQLDLPRPDVNLEVGSGTHAVQTAEIMVRFEERVLDYRPDLVLVYGDVNSTMAASIVCSKLGIPIAHVEAGLRAFDRSMPEEVNRLLTDQIADMLFVPSEDGVENLRREGIADEKIHLVGNVMIDTLVRLLPKADASWNTSCISQWRNKPYMLVTLHRPSNVDNPDALMAIVMTLRDISDSLAVIFPVHPRTRMKLKIMNDLNLNENFHLIEPLGYLEFLALQSKATVVVTDSGGIQEETSFLGVPCLTLRSNTERPVTVSMGTNILIGNNMSRLRLETNKILNKNPKPGRIPPLWDGQASERIAAIIAALN